MNLYLNGGSFYKLEITKIFLVPLKTLSIWPKLRLWLLIFQVPGATWPMFEKCFCFFEQEGVLYDFRVIKIMKRNKNIFDLSYWIGLYDQNCRIYTRAPKKSHNFEMEACSLTLNISASFWSNLATKDSFEISSS